MYVLVAPSDWSDNANIRGTAASWNVIHCPGVSGREVGGGGGGGGVGRARRGRRGELKGRGRGRNNEEGNFS